VRAVWNCSLEHIGSLAVRQNKGRRIAKIIQAIEMANPMHCDAQRNALGLSLQSISFFHAPSRSEIFIFAPMYRQGRKYAILSKEGNLGI
jgi:hypothetical protein